MKGGESATGVLTEFEISRHFRLDICSLVLVLAWFLDFDFMYRLWLPDVNARQRNVQHSKSRFLRVKKCSYIHRKHK